MKSKLYIALVLTISIATQTIAQLQTPALSPLAEIKQTLGLTKIEIAYSRPSAKGRTIFGSDGLVPFGEFWRVGANAATKLSINNDLWLGGKLIEEGAYSMLVKPAASSWNVYFYKYQSSSWNSYVAQQPLFILNIKSENTADFVETFSIGIDAIKGNNAGLTFQWEHTKVIVPIHVKVKEKVMKSIAKTLSGPSNNDYFQAALFMDENNIDLEKALFYIQKATKSTDARFFHVYREALILEKLQRRTEAVKAAKRSLELSIKAKNKDFVRLNEKLIEKLSK